MRYGLDSLIKVLKNPYLVLRELNILFHTKFFTSDFNEEGVDIHEEDWDNLIVLDACRWDFYRDYVAPEFDEGDFQRRYSKGANTKEWIKANFMDRKLHDTVYVTANSWILKIGDEINADLHAVVDAKDDFDAKQEKQLEKAVEAEQQFPNKRRIIHLLPPHHPFIGPFAEENLPSPEEQGNKMMSKVRKGEISPDKIRKAYAENLERVIPVLEELLHELDGKTVVTADHGELLGEKTSPIPVREWGHKTGLYVDELVEIPWHVFESSERPEIQSEKPPENTIDERSKKEIEEHLKKLGYKA